MKAIHLHLAAALTLTFAVAACGSGAIAPNSAPPPSARPVAAPAPVRPGVVQAPLSDSWMDAPATPGSWNYDDRGNLTLAVFVTPTRGTAMAIHCDRPSRTIWLIMAGQTGGAPTMVVRTETATRALAAKLDLGEFANVIATLRGDDPLLDAMALSKGRFAVEVQGLPPLIVPSWAEVSRVIEDCR